MEIKIASIQKGTPAQEFLPLITDAHNLRYSHAEKNCLYFQIFRKERVFLIEADKSEIIQLVKPLLVELENVNSEKDAALYLNSFQEWVHPLTLESVTAELTEEQKLIAAKMLKAYFAA